MDATSLPSESSSGEDRILVSVGEHYALARVVGRGSYKVSKSIKEFAARLLEEGHSFLLLDLQECVGMDSTFMGMLAGVSQRLQSAGGQRLVLTGVSDKLNRLMTTLGIDRLMEIRNEPSPAKPEEMRELDQTELAPEESATHILESHETLVSVDEKNKLRFQDVLDYLRQDIQRTEP